MKISINPQPVTYGRRFKKVLFINKDYPTVSDKKAALAMKDEFRPLTEPKTCAFDVTRLDIIFDKVKELGGVIQDNEDQN